MAPINTRLQRERKKYCHCTPHCGKLLLTQAHKLHYLKLSLHERKISRDSESCSSLSGNDDETMFPYDDQENYSSGSFPQTASHNTPPTSSSDEVHEKSICSKQSESNHDLIGDFGQYVHMTTNIQLMEEGWDNWEQEEQILSSPDYSNDEDNINMDCESEFDEWKRYDEGEELAAKISEQEQLNFLDEILIWNNRMY